MKNINDRIGLFINLFNLPQRLSELEEEQDGGEGYGDQVCDRFCHVDSHCLICGVDMRHNEDQWDQQDEFTHDRNDDGCRSVAESIECHLAGDLDSK